LQGFAGSSPFVKIQVLYTWFFQGFFPGFIPGFQGIFKNFLFLVLHGFAGLWLKNDIQPCLSMLYLDCEVSEMKKNNETPWTNQKAILIFLRGGKK
jgi:hypothetical protein